MKKKLITLLTLLLVVCSGAWADPTSISSDLIIGPVTYSDKKYSLTNGDYISGSWSGGSTTQTIAGTSYSYCVKLESSTTLSFVTSVAMDVEFRFTGSKLKIDDTTTADATDNVLTVSNLAAGTHTIKRNSGTTNLYAIIFTVRDSRPAAPISWSTSSASVENGGSTAELPTLTNNQSLTVSYASSKTAVATINASTGAVTLVAPGTTTISATYTSPNAEATYKTTTVSYTLTYQLPIISNQTWNVEDAELVSAYPNETFISNAMFLKNLSIADRGSSSVYNSFTDFPDGLRYQITSPTVDGSTTDGHVHFKVAGKSKIKVYTINGNSKDINLYISETYKKTWKSTDNDGKAALEYNYAGADAADVYVYTAKSGAKFLAFKVEPLTTDNPTFDPASGEVAAGSTITATSSADATMIYYKWNNSSEDYDGEWSEATATAGVASITVPAQADNTPYLHAYAEGYAVSSQVTQQYTITAADTDAPEFVSSTPADGETGVAVSGTIMLTFNETIGEVDDEKFSLNKGTISSVTIDGSNVNVAYTGLPYKTSVTLSVEAAAVSDASGNALEAALDDITFTTLVRSGCELTNIQFSNSAYGAIGTLSAGAATVTVPYMAGQAAPSVNESSIVISDGATYELDGNTLTVTAEDGTTTGTYTITKTAFSPLSVTADIDETTFTAVPSWISNPYGWASDKGVKIAKAVDEPSNMRIAKGNTRMYIFVGAAQTLTLTSGSNGDKGAINVYRNGVKLAEPTAFPKKDKTMDIALDPSVPCMIMIESNQTSGDGGFTKYAVTASTSVGGTIASSGYSSLGSALGLNFSSATGLTAAYVVTNITNSAVTLTSVNELPANSGVILKGTANASYSIPVKADAAYGGTNKLYAAVTAYNCDANEVYILQSGQFHLVTAASTVPAGKAYLKASDVPDAARSLSFLFGEDETTGINAVNRNLQNSDFFNLQGQRVDTPKKGLYIVNGKKVIVK